MQESDSNRGTTPAPEAAIGNAVLRTRMDPRTGEVMQVRPASFWRTHDARRRAEGRTLVEYAQANDLKLSTLRRWSTKLRDGDGAPGAAPRRLRPAASSSRWRCIRVRARVRAGCWRPRVRQFRRKCVDFRGAPQALARLSERLRRNLCGGTFMMF